MKDIIKNIIEMGRAVFTNTPYKTKFQREQALALDRARRELRKQSLIDYGSALKSDVLMDTKKLLSDGTEVWGKETFICIAAMSTEEQYGYDLVLAVRDLVTAYIDGYGSVEPYIRRKLDKKAYSWSSADLQGYRHFIVDELIEMLLAEEQ